MEYEDYGKKMLIYASVAIVGIFFALQALFGFPFDWTALGVAFILTFAVLLYAVYAFGRVERSFADII